MKTNLQSWRLTSPLGTGKISGYLRRYGVVVVLLASALLTRLPLLSISLDEVDAANFYNALAYGYNISWMKPHPPGYPVYIFMGWLIDLGLNNPLTSLTLLSASLGSLAIVPFYLLLREFTDTKMAFAGSLLFLINPLYWSFSETALSDVPSVFFVVLLAWLCFKARHSRGAFLWACVVASLAIGIRQPNVSFLLLLAFPLAYRALVTQEMPWRLSVLGLQLFIITTLAWLVPAVIIGSGGLLEYQEAITKQWSTAVKIYDFAHVESPWLPRFLYRIERFSLGYVLTYPWTGNDAKTAATMFLIIPWLFGFALFITSFKFRDPRYVFTALWLSSIIYSILVIHFLPRYGLPQLPGFIIACLLGYQFLGCELLKHPRRIEILSVLGIGCVLVLFAIKHQPPLGAFEYSPTGMGLYPGILFALGLLFLLSTWFMYHWPARAQRSPLASTTTFRTVTSGGHYRFVVVALLLLVIPYAVQGYSVTSIAHRTPSPSQQFAEYVKANFDATTVAPCWDNQTHSFYDAVTPDASPVGYWSLEELSDAYESGKILLVSDRCPRYHEIESAFGLVEVARFSGDSPLWAKTPDIRLYTTPRP